MKAKIVKCPCGYCGCWEVRRPEGELYQRYPSQQKAILGMGRMFSEMKYWHIMNVHQKRGGKL